MDIERWGWTEQHISAWTEQPKEREETIITQKYKKDEKTSLLQIDYIKGEDINELLSLKKFFGTKLNMLEDLNVIKFLKRNISGPSFHCSFPLIKIDASYEKYLKKVDMIYGYYLIEFSNKKWLYDEKNKVLISYNPDKYNEEEIEEKLKQKLENIRRFYEESSKPVEVKDSFTPLFDFRTDYLTDKDKYLILRDLHIPVILNSNDDKLTEDFILKCGINSRQDYDLEPIKAINHGEIFRITSFENYPDIIQMRIIRQILCGYKLVVSGSLKDSIMSQVIEDLFVTIDISKSKTEWYKTVLGINNFEYAYREEIEDIETDGLIIGEDQNNIHPLLIALFYNNENVEEYDISLAKIKYASTALYKTNNPRILEPILGKILYEDIESILNNTKGFTKREIIKKSRCSLEEEYKIRQEICIKEPEMLELFDILRSIETNRTLIEQEETIKEARKKLILN